MTIFDSLVLGAVQGLTEFLPISSSGHLILMRELLGLNTSGGLAFDAILQLATVLAVLIYFRKTILSLILQKTPEDRTLLIGLIVGTIPALILGLLLEDTMEALFRDPRLVAAALIAGSLLFVLAEKIGGRRTSDILNVKNPLFFDAPKGGRPTSANYPQVTVRGVWWVGWFQALALVPGVSRSGATISGGLLLGLTREPAARLSFLLSLPIIGGSGLKKLFDVVRERPPDIDLLPLVIASVTAFVIGIFCIHFLLSYLKRHTLYVFVWYRVALAILVLVIFR